MKKTSGLIALAAVTLLVTAVTDGCISNTKYGCDVTETLAPGATEGEVIMKHGAPDNVVYLGTAYYNPTTGQVGDIDKYLFEYRIGGGTTFLDPIYAADQFHNICYLIEGGRVLGGGYVGEGSGTILLGSDLGFLMYVEPYGTFLRLAGYKASDLKLGGFLHPKARAGYGGDGTPGGRGADVPD